MQFTKETMRAHRASWFVYAGAERIPHTAIMRGQWGYDVVCSCGWETRTGGALRRAVAEELWFHRWEAENAEPEQWAHDRSLDPDYSERAENGEYITDDE